MSGAKREDDWHPLPTWDAQQRRDPDEVRRFLVTDCFGRRIMEIKKARGLSPAPLSNYLFLAVLRRALPVFFADDFFAEAVLRFAVFLFFAAAMISLLWAGGW